MMRINRPVSRGNTALAHAFDVEAEPDPIAFDNVVPMSQRLSLLELNESTCHWPVGDPGSADFFFCGGKALNAFPTARITRASLISRRATAAAPRGPTPNRPNANAQMTEKPHRNDEAFLLRTSAQKAVW